MWARNRITFACKINGSSKCNQQCSTDRQDILSLGISHNLPIRAPLLATKLTVEPPGWNSVNIGSSRQRSRMEGVLEGGLFDVYHQKRSCNGELKTNLAIDRSALTGVVACCTCRESIQGFMLH
ncbi:unnamed protein product [Nezara viridula]|uniref:Uncharacterized protein n=1 Tax=Nezara viridula TaxID=85310 RepID=A0A9P0HB97_NEZVI|nr:unnamed protein product [Nezara viridula]